jgi:hypothetical protein
MWNLWAGDIRIARQAFSKTKQRNHPGESKLKINQDKLRYLQKFFGGLK